MDRKLKVHFLGIGGPGASGTAVIAKHSGFEVSGCDNLSQDHKFFQLLEKEDIALFHGNHPRHIADADIVAAALGLYHTASRVEEFEVAKEKGILMPWQEFLGVHILPSKTSIVVAGSHGKTTTSALLAEVLADAGKEPTVMLGDVVRDWGTNYRVGSSEYFVCEGDEKVFQYYRPNIAVINNVDYEHPEHFHDEEAFNKAFDDFIAGIHPGGLLVANVDDPGLFDTLSRNASLLRQKQITVIRHSLSGKDAEYSAEAIGESVLCVEGNVCELTIFGRHNLHNALGVYALCRELGVAPEQIAKSFKKFSGIEARIEQICAQPGLALYSDYAHHPTEVAATISALRNRHPKSEIIAVFEPHQITRINRFWNSFVEALDLADEAIVTRIYAGREPTAALPDLATRIANLSKKKFSYIEEASQIVHMVGARADEYRHACQHMGPDDARDLTVVIMGAGNSAELASDIKARVAGVSPPRPAQKLPGRTNMADKKITL